MQEIWDMSRRISCQMTEKITKYVTWSPITVDMLDVQNDRADRAGEVDCWMDVFKGIYPNVRYFCFYWLWKNGIYSFKYWIFRQDRLKVVWKSAKNSVWLFIWETLKGITMWPCVIAGPTTTSTFNLRWNYSSPPPTDAQSISKRDHLT